MLVYAVYADKKTSRVLLIVFEDTKVPDPSAPEILLVGAKVLAPSAPRPQRPFRSRMSSLFNHKL